MEALTASKHLFSDWNKHHIKYCHWKSNEHLLEGLAGETDLDILCDKEDASKAKELLIKNNYIHVESQYGSKYPGVEDWIGFDQKTGKLIHIHLHFFMITGHLGLKEYNLPWTALALQTRVFSKQYEIFIVPPELEIVILLTRIGLKATVFSKLKVYRNVFTLEESDCREITYLKNNININKTKEIVEQYFGENTELFMELVEKDNIDSKCMKQLIFVTRHAMNKYCRMNKAKANVLRYYYYVILMLRHVLKKHLMVRISTKKKISSVTDASIAIIGQDGAGKSTVIQELTKWLSWKMDVQVYYMGSGDGYFSLLKAAIKGLSNNKMGRLITPVLALLNYIQIAEHLKQNAKSARKMALKGSIILFDRFPQTKYLGINDGPKIRVLCEKRHFSKVVSYVLRKMATYEEKCYLYAAGIDPALVIKLLLPPEVSIKRKPQESIIDVKKKHDIIKNLSFPNSKQIIIDATMDFDEEIIIIHKAIWDILCMKNTNNTKCLCTQ